MRNAGKIFVVMKKNIQNQSEIKKMFSLLKSDKIQCNGYSLYYKNCSTAPLKSSAMLWPYYIAYEQWKKGYVCRHNSVRHFVLQLILDGNMRIADDRKEITVDAGMVGVIPPCDNLIMAGDAGFCETVCIVFNGTVLDAISNSAEILSPEVLDPVPESFLLSMLHLIEMKSMAESSPIDISAESFKLLMETSELLQKESALPRNLSLALHYMSSVISNKLTMSMLTRNACCSRQELQKLFRIHFNETPFEHFGKMRLATAVEFLKNSRLPIKEISVQCGFKSQLYFSTVFRKHYGVPPREFREKFSD